jgi:large subunit ribosomal protein L10
MKRAQKVESIEQLGGRFGRAPIAIATDYRGLNVAEISELRAKVREAEGEFLVAKNTLARIAIKETSFNGLEEFLVGPMAIAFGYSDAVAVSKAIVDFAKEHEALEIKGAVLDGELLDEKQVAQLAKMPGRDELRAQLLALLTTPATNLVRLLQAPAQQMVQVLQAKSQQES